MTFVPCSFQLPLTPACPSVASTPRPSPTDVRVPSGAAVLAATPWSCQKQKGSDHARSVEAGSVPAPTGVSWASGCLGRDPPLSGLLADPIGTSLAGGDGQKPLSVTSGPKPPTPICTSNSTVEGQAVGAVRSGRAPGPWMGDASSLPPPPAPPSAEQPALSPHSRNSPLGLDVTHAPGLEKVQHQS